MPTAQENWQQYASPHTFYHVTDIFQQGDLPQAVWFICSGEVKLVRLESEGQELIYNIRSAGRWLGLGSALKQMRYEFTATPLTTCQVLRLPVGTFQRLFRTDPEFAWLVAQELAGNLIELYERLAQVAIVTPRHQLEHYLRRAAEERGRSGNGDEVRLRLPLKRKELARMINVTPQYVSELLTELEAEGVLRRSGRELTIIDRGRLRPESFRAAPRSNH